MFLAHLLSFAASAETVEVEAAVISALPDQYNGQRVRTQLSLMNLLQKPAAKAMGCKKDTTGFLLGPKLEMGKPPAMLSGTWVLCADVETTTQLAAQPTSTGVVLEGLLNIDGPKVARRLRFEDARLVQVIPMEMPAIR